MQSAGPRTELLGHPEPLDVGIGWPQAPSELEASGAPTIPTEPVPACPVCRHDRFQVHGIGFDYELLTCQNPWRFVRCGRCSHVWLNPRPALHTLPIIYPPHYYAYNYTTQVHRLARHVKQTLDALKLRKIFRLLERRPASYLDVGCGDGRYLRALERRGVSRARNHGLELDERTAASLSAEGFQVACRRVEDCEHIPEGSIDLATLFHVIEHVDDPARVVRKIASWLAPGGVLALETPNLESLDARLFQRSFWGGYHIPRHWNLFTPASLERLLREAGLEPCRTLYQTGHSFWSYSIHHALRYGPNPRPALARWFDPLRSLPALTLFTAFDKVRAALGSRTSAMLVVARRP